jgi:Cu-Zn family superoxide dismutase
MKKLVLLAISVLLFAACASMSTGPSASATLSSTSGSTATGTVKLAQLSDGSVRVTADLTGVPPGTHGFHVHVKGDCGDYGNAAGGHFNPHTTEHGAPSADQQHHHAGDFGNVIADASGRVHTQFETFSITVAPGPTSAVGHAIILHANPDDLVTQPTGNAGAHIACGVVTLN